MLIRHPPNLFYLFNFSGSSALALVLRNTSHLLIDGRYTLQAKQETVACHTLETASPFEKLGALFAKKSASASVMKIGFESEHFSFDSAQKFLELFPNVAWTPVSGMVERLRTVKEPAEVVRIRLAFQKTLAAYEDFIGQIRPGLSEIDMAGILESEMRAHGSEGVAFETIVASGPRSSLPHARATSRVWRKSEPLMVDFGLRHHGYTSDVTRMIYATGAKKPSIHKVVQEAQSSAIKAVKPGRISTEIDAAARDIIKKSGLAQYFPHSTGHGLGIEVHEGPLISWRKPCELQEGMIFTVEPGIYLPGNCGVRLEDTVLVTATGAQVLSRPSNTKQ